MCIYIRVAWGLAEGTSAELVLTPRFARKDKIGRRKRVSCCPVCIQEEGSTRPDLFVSPVGGRGNREAGKEGVNTAPIRLK